MNTIREDKISLSKYSLRIYAILSEAYVFHKVTSGKKIIGAKKNIYKDLR